MTTHPDSSFSSQPLELSAGGQPIIELRAPAPENPEKPAFISAHILPGRGMNTFQITAHIPGTGAFDMLTAPPLAEAPGYFDNSPDDFMGNRSFMVGGALLIPFPNRIRGELIADGKSIVTTVLGKTVILPANWSSGGSGGGEKTAMHGLVLKTHAHELMMESDDSSARVTGIMKTGDFDGRWVGWSRVTTVCTLKRDAFELTVTVRNDGDIPLPVSVGWHPYFEFPSGRRGQCRIRVPARSIIETNNYDDVFPTGKISSVEGTPFDFRSPEGVELGGRYLDDCFTGLDYDADGLVTVEITDPAAAYGVRIRANRINRAVQLYSPPDRNFIAVEPQMSFADPFNATIWGKRPDAGMEVVGPDSSVTYSVTLKLFVPLNVRT